MKTFPYEGLKNPAQSLEVVDSNNAPLCIMAKEDVLRQGLPHRAVALLIRDRSGRALLTPVSYTHLDVYKRQILANLERGRDVARKAVVTAVCLPGLDLPEPKTKATDDLPCLQAAPPRAEHPVVELLRHMQPEELSPLDALKTLMEWKSLWGTAATSSTQPQDSQQEAPEREGHGRG